MSDLECHGDGWASSQWFYEKGGQRIGGVPKAEIIGLIKAAKLNGDSLVWREGLPNWQELGNTELANYIDKSTPPSLPATHVNNTMAWVLAFAPFLGQIVRGGLLGFMYAADAPGVTELRVKLAIQNGELWYTTLILNVLLCFWDERRLKKAGVDTSKFRGWVWLVPVYLYSRAKTLNQRLAYFWVWISLVVLLSVGS